MTTTYTDNGTNTPNGSHLDFTFTFPVLQTEDVKVALNGVTQTTTKYSVSTSPTAKITFNNTSVDSSVQESTGAPKTGVLVRVYRQTTVHKNNGDSDPKAVFSVGSSIRAGDLNNNVDQALFGIAELQEKKLTSENIQDGAITSSKISDGTIVNADISGSAAIAQSKIATGNLPSGITVNSANIVNGSIVNEDISATADIAGSKLLDDSVTLDKLGSGALPTDITIHRDNIVNGTIQDADIETGTLDNRYYTETELNNGQLDNRYYTETELLTGGAIDGRYYTESELDSGQLDNRYFTETELSGGALDGRYFTETEIANGAADTRYYTEAELNGGQLNTLYFTEAEITGGAADGRYYTETELDAGQLDNRYFTETELTNGALDGRYYTETEAEAKFLRQDSSETIASGATWSNSDSFVATTAAINARIIDLIDDVGGFTVIANENSFPNSNPQGTAGQAAILSIGAVTTTLTPSSGTVTIANGRLNNGQVLITGVPAAIPQGFGLLVESTSTDHTYAFHRLVPKATEITTVASNITNIVAAGVNVADINNFADLYQISNNAPTQRVDGNSLQDGDLWFDNSNGNLRVWDGSAWAVISPNQNVLNDIAIVSGAITYQEDLGLIGDPVATGSSNGSLDIVADILEDEATFTVTASGGAYLIDGVSKPALTLYKGWTYTFDLSSNTLGSHPLRFYANSSQYSTDVTVTGTQGTAGAKVSIKIPETQLANFQYYCTNHSGMGNTITVKDDPIKTVSDNVTEILAVAGNSTNINAVAGNNSNITAVAGNATNINAVQSNATNINAVNANKTNIDVVAGNNSNITAVANNSSNINSAVSNASNINAAVSNASNINSAVSNATNINTVAGNISDVNNFADIYQIASSDPSTDGGGNSLAQGDLYFNSSANELKVYNGGSWQGGVTATGNFAATTGNTFTGDNTYNDNVKAKFGGSSDLEIYHDSNYSYVADKGVGELRLASFNGNGVRITKGDSETLANFSNGGAAELFYANGLKLETTNTGATITGLMTATTIDGAAGDNLQLDFGTL